MPWPTYLPTTVSQRRRAVFRALLAIDLAAAVVVPLTAAFPWFQITTYSCAECAPTIVRPSLLQLVSADLDWRFAIADALLAVLLFCNLAAAFLALQWFRWHVVHVVIVAVLGFLWLFVYTGLLLSANAQSDIGMNTAFVGILVMGAANGALERALGPARKSRTPHPA